MYTLERHKQLTTYELQFNVNRFNAKHDQHEFNCDMFHLISAAVMM